MSLGPRLLKPGWQRPARLAWLGSGVLVVVVAAAAAPFYYRLLDMPCDTDCAYFQLSAVSARALQHAGLPPHFYAYWLTALTVVTLALAWLLASVVFWRPGNHVMAAYLGLALLPFSLAFFSVMTTALVASQPAWRWPVALAEALGLWTVSSFGLLFPSGYVVPHWLWPLAYVGAALSLALAATSTLARALAGEALLSQWLLGGVVALGVLGGAAQVYRYRHVSRPAERQQAKWVVLGFTLLLAVGSVFVLAGWLVSPFRRPGLANALYYLVGGTANTLGVLTLLVSFSLAILRYRLWDIDVIIRRTLVYAVLTAVLAVAYLGSVLVLQTAFGTLTGQSQSALVTVLSTLLIAALFVPLRRRVQAAIDQRFFRRKYDAARTLAAFGAALRDEVELGALTDSLLGVVDETMQPASVGLWLAPAQPAAAGLAQK